MNSAIRHILMFGGFFFVLGGALAAVIDDANGADPIYGILGVGVGCLIIFVSVFIRTRTAQDKSVTPTMNGHNRWRGK